jgi:hypothetical protein
MSFRNGGLLFCLRGLEVIMQVLIFFIILFALSNTFVTASSTNVMSSLLGIVCPILVLYLARHHVRKGIFLFIIHIGVAFYMIMIGNSLEEKAVTILVGIILIIFSLVLSTKEDRGKEEKIPVGLGILFVVAVLLGDYMGTSILTKAGIYCGEIYIIVHVLYYNLSNLYEFIVINRDISSIPVKQMMVVNSFLMTILVTLSTGVMLLFGNTYITKMLLSFVTLIKEAIIFTLKILLSLFKSGDSKEIISDTIEKSKLFDFANETQDSAWVDILEGIWRVLEIVLVILAITLFIIGVVITLVRLLNRMSSSSSEKDTKEFIIIKEIRRSFTRHSKKGSTDYSANGKIRKLYKALVIRNATKSGNIIKSSMVPKDISDQYIQGNSSMATEIYERARYSNRQITQEDIEVLKKIKNTKERG